MPTLPESQWERLAVPFPDDEVKQRPGAAKWDHKPSCEGARCRETRNPEAHVQFSYVDARAVAQRLDDVLTPDGWDFTCATIPGTDVVKGSLRIGGTIREDHGYPNSDRDDEPIKAATSDALKRCAVLYGIGRHLYEDNRPHKSPVARPAAHAAGHANGGNIAPPRSSTAVPDDFSDLDFQSLSPVPPTAVATMVRPVLTGNQAITDRPLSDGENWCPVHGLAWALKPAGISKTGAPYDPFWACSSKDKPWCKEKPTAQWIKAHQPEPVA